MGDLTQKFGRALDANAARDRELQNTAQNIEAQTKAFALTNANLRSIADNLEERDQRSKWDWVTLAAGMAIAALLAGTGAFFAAKANIVRDDFSRSVQLIQNNDNAFWCRQADGQIINASNGSAHCAIHMPQYQVPEPAE